jgi:hypothetical protein
MDVVLAKLLRKKGLDNTIKLLEEYMKDKQDRVIDPKELTDTTDEYNDPWNKRNWEQQ